MFIVFEDRKKAAFLFEKLKKKRKENDGQTLFSIFLSFILYVATIFTFVVTAVISRVSEIFRAVSDLYPYVLSRYTLLEDETNLKESRVIFIRVSFP